MHNIGDIGSFVGGVPTHSQDGADEYLLVIDPEDPSIANILSVYDGFTGGRLWDLPLPAGYEGRLATGYDVAGSGKNIVGTTASSTGPTDSYPDFAVGVQYKNSPIGTVVVYDGATAELGPVRIAEGFNLVGVKTSGQFGLSLEVVGDLELDPFVHPFDHYSEILVGDPGYDDDPLVAGFGAVHVLDLNPFHWPAGEKNFVVKTFKSPIQHDRLDGFMNSVFFNFTADLGTLGDPFAYDATTGIGRLGHEANMHWPEFVASDYTWSEGGTSGEDNGMWCWMTLHPLKQDPLVILNDANPTRKFIRRGGDVQRMGVVVSPTTDSDADDLTDPDYRAYGHLVVAPTTPADDTNFAGVILNKPDDENRNWYEYSLPALLMNYFYSIFGSQRFQAQAACGIGDINLDDYDDFVYLPLSNPDPDAKHEIVVVSGADPLNGPNSILYRATLWNGYKMRGCCDELVPNFCTSEHQRTAAVGRLGDVDLDGVCDFAVATGIDIDDVNDGCFGFQQKHSDVSLVLVFGSGVTASPTTPPTPPGKPKIRGNVVAQAHQQTAALYDATRIVIRVENGIAGQSVDLYESTTLLPPGPPQAIPMCDGFLRVDDPAPDRKTFNVDKVATYIYWRNFSQTPIGGRLYFQAVANPGSPGCKLSGIHTVTFVDSSNPYQLLRN